MYLFCVTDKMVIVIIRIWNTFLKSRYMTVLVLQYRFWDLLIQRKHNRKRSFKKCDEIEKMCKNTIDALFENV